MIAVNVLLQGSAELQSALAALPVKISRQVVRTGVRKGTQLVRDAQRRAAKSVVGGRMGNLLAKHIVTHVPKRRLGEYTISVMFRKGVDEFVHVTKAGVRYYIPHAIEFGHALPGHGHGGGGGAPAPKDVAAMPFMRPAAQQNRQRAMEEVMSVLRSAMARENARVPG